MAGALLIDGEGLERGGLVGKESIVIDDSFVVGFEGAWNIVVTGSGEDFINEYKAKGVSKWGISIGLLESPVESREEDGRRLAYRLEFKSKQLIPIGEDEFSIEIGLIGSPTLSVLIDPFTGEVISRWEYP